MSETVTMNMVYEELKGMKKELAYIKNHMVDVDMFLTPEEEVKLEEALEEHKKGKTISLDKLKAELGR
ncbi:MAG: hypothetical protein AABX82_01505 [Nanoarchaeota archaeon]